jgi:ubiquinone/menaquinone biosynthesis C-methylase UbiE
LIKGGATVIGLDFSRQGLLACQRSVGSVNLELVEGDVTRLPFAERCMDHVVAFHVLGHLNERGRQMAVEEVKRVIRIGGTVMVRVFSMDDMRYGMGSEIEPNTFVRGTGISCHFFTRSELLDLFSSFQMLSFEEVRVPKKFDGKDMVRSELVGSFALEKM